MSNAIEKVRLACDLLEGERCWYTSAGSGTGSHVILSFGRKIPRLVPLKNPFLSSEARENKGEYSIYITCVWRLDNRDEVVCGAWDDNRAGQPMLEGLTQLPGRRIEKIKIRRPGLDLEIRFDKGLRLTVFCDQMNEHDGDDNYSILIPEHIVIVGTRSVVRLEARVPG